MAHRFFPSFWSYYIWGGEGIIFYPLLIYFSVAVTANSGGILLPFLFPTEHGS